jgi:hypothetical protein
MIAPPLLLPFPSFPLEDGWSRLTSPYGWSRLMVGLALWLVSPDDWSRLMVGLALWLVSPYVWSRLMVGLALWLVSPYDWSRLMVGLALRVVSPYRLIPGYARYVVHDHRVGRIGVIMCSN